MFLQNIFDFSRVRDRSILVFGLPLASLATSRMDILAQMKEAPMKGESPDHKRPRSDANMFGASASTSGSLTTPEVTKILLQHDQDLRQLHAALTLAMRVEADAELSKTLLHCVRVWQKQHTKGRAHPMGACGTATATVLFDLILSHVQNTPTLKNDMAVGMLRNLVDSKQPTLIAAEVAHCSARMNAKETHLILEVRLTSSSTLQPFFPWLRMCLCSMGAEILGSKPLPNWARRVRAQQ